MKKILILFFIIIPVFNAYASHTPGHTEGDNVDYISNKNMNETKYKFSDSYIHHPTNYLHLYGYISSTYTHEENPYCYSDDTLRLLSAEQEDDYYLNKLYLWNFRMRSKKMNTNQPSPLIDCTDESFSATLVYKFHFI